MPEICRDCASGKVSTLDKHGSRGSQISHRLRCEVCGSTGEHIYDETARPTEDWVRGGMVEEGSRFRYKGDEFEVEKGLTGYRVHHDGDVLHFTVGVGTRHKKVAGGEYEEEIFPYYKPTDEAKDEYDMTRLSVAREHIPE